MSSSWARPTFRCLRSARSSKPGIRLWLLLPAPASGWAGKERLTPVPALELGLRCAPCHLRDVAAQADLATLDADIAVVVAYGLIPPQAVLDAPRKVLNIPRLPAAARRRPHRSTGRSWRGMQKPVSASCRWRQGWTQVGSDARGHSDHARGHHRCVARPAVAMGARLIVDTLSRQARSPDPSRNGGDLCPQDRQGRGQIDWTVPAEQAGPPNPGAVTLPGGWTERNGERMKLASELAEGQVNRVRCWTTCWPLPAAKAVRLLRLQRAGKAGMCRDVSPGAGPLRQVKLSEPTWATVGLLIAPAGAIMRVTGTGP